VDNIVYKGEKGDVTIDLIDLNSGEISLTEATQDDDFYAWSYVDSSKEDAIEAAKNGAIAGAALGAIIGTCIEPGVGTVVGAAIGAVAGGVAGAVKENGVQGVKDVAEAIWDWF
jgi:outer membrane lipoprotein SlyB